MTDTNNNIISSKGKTFRRIQEDGFDGYGEMRVPPHPEADPFIKWNGPKISLEEWARILAFFEWSNKTYHGEAQVRLFANFGTGRIVAWAFPQFSEGMTTRENENDPAWQSNADRVSTADGYRYCGTVHHHCGMGAFQSGVDKSDETTQNGLHITVGKIGCDTYDIHARVCLNGNQQQANLAEWFEKPADFEQLPAMFRCFEDSMFRALLLMPPALDTPFPIEWRMNVSKRYYQHTGHSHSSPTPVGTAMSTYHSSEQHQDRRTIKTPNHMPTCCCISCEPTTGGHRTTPHYAHGYSGGHSNGSFPKSAGLNEPPAPGAATNKGEAAGNDDDSGGAFTIGPGGETVEVDLRSRISRALKKVYIPQPSDLLEEKFVQEVFTAAHEYMVSDDRLFELICWAIVNYEEEIAEAREKRDEPKPTVLPAVDPDVIDQETTNEALLRLYGPQHGQGYAE